MAKFILTKKAFKDLSSIWNYTFDEWSETQAEKYYLGLLVDCQNLAENPKIGKKYQQIQNDLYGFQSSKHIIFFRKLGESEIEITRILHQRMDIKSRFKDK